MEKVIATLKEIIDQNGPAYLEEEPYKVYLELTQNGDVDRNTAGLVLYAFVNDVQSEVDSDCDPILLLKAIQNRCGLSKKTADCLLKIFLALYSKENKKEWKAKDREGFSQFLEEDFECTWKGSAIWEEGNGTIDCYYQAEIILSPSGSAVEDQELSLMLKRNPFMTKEAIRQYFEKDFCQYLDDEFEEYCTCDDYYQPVVEDFDIDYYVSEWCGKHGFEVVSCDGSGGDGGYESKYRRN